METEQVPKSAVFTKEEPKSPANGKKLSFPNKSRKDAFKCSCTDGLTESDTPSVTESVSSKASSAASFIIVSESATHTKQKCCLRQRCWSVFNSERFSDVTLIVGQGDKKQRIPAHKVILSIGSDVFNTLFSKDWSAEAAEIEVPDVEPSAFKEASLFEDQNLIDSCLDKIDEDTVEAIDTDGFRNVDVKMLRAVLERNTLTISEVELFKAVLGWSEVECSRKNLPNDIENRQSVVKGVLPLIRFPLMSIEEFSSEVAHTGLLTKEELLSMFLYFTTKPRPSVAFNNTPRLSDKELVVSRFKTSSNRLSPDLNDERWDRIDFTCDFNLELLGYGLHGSVSGAAKYEVKMELKDTLTGNILLDECDVFVCDGTSITYRALFRNPIKLTALEKYTAGVCIQGPNCFIGEEGLEKVTAELQRGQKVTITFSTCIYDKCLNLLTTVDRGLISQLIFKV